MDVEEQPPPTADEQRRDELERLIADLALRVILDRQETHGRGRDHKRN